MPTARTRPPTPPSTAILLRQLDAVLARVEHQLARLGQDTSQVHRLATQSRVPAVAELLDQALDQKQQALHLVEAAHHCVRGALVTDTTPADAPRERAP